MRKRTIAVKSKQPSLDAHLMDEAIRNVGERIVRNMIRETLIYSAPKEVVDVWNEYERLSAAKAKR